MKTNLDADIEKRIIPGKTNLQAMELRPIKMKDKAGRDRIVLDMKKNFGFIPELLIIDKVHGESNTIKISAIVPDKNGEKIK